MSAADWTRIKRQRGGLNYLSDAAVPPPTPSVNHGSLLIPRDVGGSKIRFTASDYTNYVASLSTDYVLQASTGVQTNGTRRLVTRLCNCTTSVLAPKVGVCTKCAR
jgi:hypothetical protein